MKMLTNDIYPTSGDALLSGLSVLRHQQQIKEKVGYCFAESDTRILTSHGLLFLEQIEALLGAGQEVLYGCYEEQSKKLVYSKGELVYKPPPEDLVEFTSPGEDARWAEGSGDYGREGVPKTKSKSYHVSLRVTPDHDMYVQQGNVTADGSRTHWTKTGGRTAPHRKMPAQDLLPEECKCPAAQPGELDCAHRRAHVRMLACAEEGYAPQATSKRLAVLAALHLDATQFPAFIELLGFWLGDGTLEYHGSGGGYVTFSQVKQADIAWLRRTFNELGLKRPQHWLFNNNGGLSRQTQLRIKKPAWFAFFDKEFGAKYLRSQYGPPSAAAASPGGRSSSSSSSSSSPASPARGSSLSLSTASTQSAGSRSGAGELRSSASFSSNSSRTASGAEMELEPTAAIASRTRSHCSVDVSGPAMGVFADLGIETEIVKCCECEGESYERVCDMCIDVGHMIARAAWAERAERDVSMDDGEMDGKAEDPDFSLSDSGSDSCPSVFDTSDSDADLPLEEKEQEDEPPSKRRQTTLDAYYPRVHSQPADGPSTLEDYSDDEVMEVDAPGGGGSRPALREITQTVTNQPAAAAADEEAASVTFHAAMDEDEDEKKDEPVKLETDEPDEAVKSEPPSDDEPGDSGDDADGDDSEEEEKRPPPGAPAVMPPGWGISWGPGVQPEAVKSVKHLPDWTLQELPAAEMRLLIRGLHRADGSFADQRSVIWTSSARFRDQLMQALLHCGYSAYAGLKYREGTIRGYKALRQRDDNATYPVSSYDAFPAEKKAKFKPIKATVDAWQVTWAQVGQGRKNTANAGACWPSMPRQQCVTNVKYDKERDGRIWCVEVQHDDQLIIAQRAKRGKDGHTVTKQSRPVIVGNCPQFDALMSTLTAREHLYLFARIKGVKEELLAGYVQSMIDRLGLQAGIADRPCKGYSGGNKRKLCVGLALVGNPPIVFLDEPSTGMDPASRRFMWDFIAHTMKGRAVILTTHSMEEAEALCQRIAIMVGGALRCLGNAQRLKSLYGDGYQLAVTLAPDQLAAFQQEMSRLFPACRVVEALDTLLKYEIPKLNSDGSRVSIGSVFRLMEQLKVKYGVREYAVSETDLERIFIRHCEQDRIKHGEHPGAEPPV